MMKKHILLLTILASNGVFADIEWLDEHEPCFDEYANILPADDNFIKNEDFFLEDSVVDELKDQNFTLFADSEFEIEESTLEELIGVGDASEDELDYLLAVVDFDIEEPPVKKEQEEITDDIFFVLKDDAYKDPIKKERSVVAYEAQYEIPLNNQNEKNNEIASLEPQEINHRELVAIGEVGPFSQFSMNGKGIKSPIKKDREKKSSQNSEMLFFPKEGFYLSPKKVTNEEYQGFVKATCHRPPSHWFKGEIPEGLEDSPVVNVTYKDAFLYSVWVGKRLPKESELQLAAKTYKETCDINPDIAEWTSTPSIGKQNNSRAVGHVTMNSELSRITYHKIFEAAGGVDSKILDSNSYNQSMGFRVAGNSSNHNPI